MNKFFYKFRLLGILMFLAVIAVFSAVTMLLWNALMPDVFGLSTCSPAFSYRIIGVNPRNSSLL
jgi:hypothetical protein